MALSRIKQTLLVTTRNVKERFGRPRRLRKAGGILDSEMGFLHVRPGDVFDGGRYATIAMLGQGQYATVWLATDNDTGERVALKILSRYCYGYGQDIMELEVTRKIATVSAGSGHAGRNHIAQLKQDFQHKSAEGHKHVVMVFGLLAATLDVTAKGSPEYRIPVSTSKEVARQMLLALDFLHTECGVIHSDIHHTNVMAEFSPDESEFLSNISGTRRLVDYTIASKDKVVSAEAGFQLRLIDFGISSFFDKHFRETQIQPEPLRAPEVSLHGPWSEKIDIWNLGTLMFEWVLGEKMFPGKAAEDGSYSEEDDRLAKLAEAFGEDGRFPSSLIRSCSRGSEIFDVEEGGLLRIQHVVSTPLEWVVDSGPRGHPSQQLPATMRKEEVPIFCDFLRQMLKLDPSERLTAREMLQHPWIESRNTMRDSARYYRYSYSAASNVSGG